MAKLRLSVDNFGPVKQGTFELSPLTVFIGPNNTGKSYVALLLYVFCKAVTGLGPDAPYFRFSRRRYPRLRIAEFELLAENEAGQSEFRDWLLGWASTKREKLTWSELPAKIQQLVTEGLESCGESVRDSLSRLLGDYFAVQDAHELIRWGAGQKVLSIRLSQRGRRSILFDANLATESDNWDATWLFPTTRPPVGKPSDLLHSMLSDDSDVMYYAVRLAGEYWDEMMSASGFPRGNAYYLPAARSGILGAWQVFASMALGITRRQFGRQRIEIPAFSGVTGDFLETLFEIFQRRRTVREMRTVLDALDVPILQGEVRFSGRRADQPLFVYNTKNSQIPIHRASSMVAELAPLSLWVQHALHPGDLVIIDEPEAHLHPDNQRRIATVLVRLVRAGITVLCTTHSSLILHQLSNHILLSHAKAQDRERLGFTPDDVLGVADLGVYLFDPGPEGSQIKPVPIDPETGIEEEEFVRVMEAIGDETYRLSVTREGAAG